AASQTRKRRGVRDLVDVARPQPIEQRVRRRRRRRDPGEHGRCGGAGATSGVRGHGAPPSSTSKRTPCASGRSSEKLIVQVCRRIYAFHESLPASRPPPVSFSPPNAPPISAPDVPTLTLAMPQSLPAAARKRSALLSDP